MYLGLPHSDYSDSRGSKALIDMTLVEAIARQEGFHVAGSRSQRNHNPGNINYGLFARLHGATGGDDKGYAVFADDGAGLWALDALLKSARYKGHTLAQAIAIFCPPTGDPRGENDTAAYIRNVSVWTGIHPDESIDGHV